MKQRIIFCIILLLVFGNLRNEISGQDAHQDPYLSKYIELALMTDPFWHLSAEEKVEKLLEELRHEISWVRTATFFRYNEILRYNNPRENIPVVLDYFEKTDMKPFRQYITPKSVYQKSPNLKSDAGSDYAHQILDFIIVQNFLRESLLTQDDLNRFCTIYQQKIHKYLETYKTVDLTVILAESTIDHITGKNEYRHLTDPEIARALLEKYTEMGYKDLQRN